jgi:hypothetical protein
MVKLSEIRGLGGKRVELPDGSVIEQDLDAEIEVAVDIERMIRGMRSACVWEGCRDQSAPGSRHCAVHLTEILRPKGKG